MILSRKAHQARSQRGSWAVVLGLVLVLFAGPILAEGMMTPQTFNRLERIYDLLDEEEYTTALERLKTTRERAQNEHEHAVIAQLFGVLHINMEDYRKALEEFTRAVEVERGLPEDRRLAVMQNVIQLHAQFEEYEDALDWIDRYLIIVDESEDRDEAPSRIYLIGAQIHMQLEQFREALPFITKAIDLSEEPQESHYRAKLGILFELDEFRDASELLESMVSLWPEKMQYWFQLFQVSWQLEREDTALSVLKLAHRKGLFETEDHYVNLFRMYMMEGAPYDAGHILEEGMEEEVVPRNIRRLEMLSRAWIQSQERDRAVAVLSELSELRAGGEDHYRIAQIEQERGAWDAVRVAAIEAYERGELDNPGNALLLAGRAAAESKQYDEALAIFNRALEYEQVRNQAGSWVQFVQEEQALMEQD